jgi:hypothetical protein
MVVAWFLFSESAQSGGQRIRAGKTTDALKSLKRRSDGSGGRRHDSGEPVAFTTFLFSGSGQSACQRTRAGRTTDALNSLKR